MQSSFKLAQAPTTQQVLVTFELYNTHPTQTYFVCHYYTPLESIMGSDSVQVTNVETNTLLPYAGFKASRILPQPKSYLQVDPGKVITNTLNLASGYRFGQGHFSVTVGAACKKLNVTLDPQNESTNQRVDHQCEPLEFIIE